jgi:hypothetical protein
LKELGKVHINLADVSQHPSEQTNHPPPTTQFHPLISKFATSKYPKVFYNIANNAHNFSKPSEHPKSNYSDRWGPSMARWQPTAEDPQVDTFRQLGEMELKEWLQLAYGVWWKVRAGYII